MVKLTAILSAATLALPLLTAFPTTDHHTHHIEHDERSLEKRKIWLDCAAACNPEEKTFQQRVCWAVCEKSKFDHSKRLNKKLMRAFLRVYYPEREGEYAHMGHVRLEKEILQLIGHKEERIHFLDYYIIAPQGPPPINWDDYFGGGA